MIALELTDVKNFMNKLLREETFDHFLLQEAVIVGAVTYSISGQITKGFFQEEELIQQQLEGLRFLPFSALRRTCFDIIKGKKTPSSFRFIFLLSPDNQKKTIASIGSSFQNEDVTGMYINLRYQNQLLSLTTGISYNVFSVDKTLENQWDQMVMKFLTRNEIPYEDI